MTNRVIIFDTETTGLSPRKGDRIVEFGAVEMVDGRATGRTLQHYYNPERSMPEEATRIHGLTDQFLSNKPKFASLVDELLAFIHEATLVAHNASFDMAFLNMELERLDREPISPTWVIDTLAIAKRKFAGSANSLDALCSRFGIDRSHREKHGALLDSELLMQVYIELTGGRQIGLGFEQPDMAAYSPYTENLRKNSDLAPALDTPVRKIRQFPVPEDEIRAHQKFIDGINAPLWRRL